MIIDYETAFFEDIRTLFPEFVNMSYAADESIFDNFTQVNKLPRFYFNRGSDGLNLITAKSLTFYDSGVKFSVTPVTISYVGYILVEKQVDAYSYSTRIFNYFKNTPKINVRVNGQRDLLSVQQKVLYIKITTLKNPASESGSVRAVEFSWNAPLYFEAEVDSNYRNITGFEIKVVEGTTNDLVTKINYK